MVNALGHFVVMNATRTQFDSCPMHSLDWGSPGDILYLISFMYMQGIRALSSLSVLW